MGLLDIILTVLAVIPIGFFMGIAIGIIIIAMIYTSPLWVIGLLIYLVCH